MNKNKKLCIITLIILFLFSISVHADACGNIKIGVIGASNTVPSYSYANQLKKLCPDTTVIKHGRNGYNPKKQFEELLKKNFKDKDFPLDVLIVNPSGNGCYKGASRCGDTYIKGVKDIADYAKKKGTKVVAIMGVGAARSTPLGKSRRGFNDYLENEKLGIPESIDVFLELVSAVATDGTKYGGADPKYMSDASHDNTLGHQRFAVAIYNRLFSANHPLPSSKTEWDALIEKFKKISSPAKPLISGSKPAPQPITPSLFSFAVISDTHDHGGCLIGQGLWVKKAAKLIAAKNPAFVIGNGDLIAGYGSKCKSDLELGTKQLDEFKKQFLDNLGGIPFLPVSGNHDLMGLNINDNTIKLIDQWKTFWNQRKPSGLQISGDYPFNYRLEHKGSGFAFSKYHVPSSYGKRHGLEQGELD